MGVKPNELFKKQSKEDKEAKKLQKQMKKAEKKTKKAEKQPKEKASVKGMKNKKISFKEILQKLVEIGKKLSKKMPNMSLKLQLIIGFVIPICFVVLVGAFAYSKASEGMLGNYEESTIKAIDMAVKLIDYGFESVESDSLQLSIDDNIKNYVMDRYKNDTMAKSSAYNDAKTLMMAKQTVNKFVKNIFIITKDELNNFTTSGSISSSKDMGMYDKFMEEYNSWDTDSMSKTVGSWNAYHTVIDEQYNVKPESYVCAKYRMLTAGSGCIVIDVDTDKIQEILEGLNMGEDSILAFVTKDGKELFTGEATDFSFCTQEYYTTASEGKEDSYSTYVHYKGREYLYMYSRCSINGASINALVPKTELMGEAIALRNGVILMVLLSCAVVIVIGFVILYGISNKMSSITRRLAKVSAGDLTVDMRIKDKAEFGKLSAHIMDMVSHTKDLIAEVKGISGEVGGSVEQVAEASNILKESTQNIHGAMNEIDLGVTQQANDAEQCLIKMDSLSGEIIKTGNNIGEMSKIAEETQDMINSGTTSMDQLIQQANETGMITTQVGEKIAELSQSAESIKLFADTINDIAEETTLLSLNASIEAARAGSAGRGFAVVAEAIKKLAESSLQSSGEIRKVMEQINKMTKETTKASEEASKIVQHQSQTVEQTRKVFGEMSESIVQLLDIIGKIADDMEQMTKVRGETLLSIESISSVSEETAASSNVINDTVSKQMSQVDNLLQATNDLNTKMQELLDAIQIFTVE